MNFRLDWNEKEVRRAVDMAVECAITEGAEDVLRDAQAACPVERAGRGGSGWKRRVPGSLRKSGRIVRWKKNGAIGAYVKFGGRGYMVDGVDTYYAPFVELGTPGKVYRIGRLRGKDRTVIEEKPFLRRALRKNKAKIQAKFRDRLK